MIVRGICCLVPGIKGISENITIYSIVGQLLEHSRIFRFENAGDPQAYMGSADWMPRNLDRRVELVFPVEDEALKKRVFKILDTMLSDTVNMRVQRSDTTYKLVDKRGKKLINSQLEFSKKALKTQRSAIKNIDSEEKSKAIGTPQLPERKDESKQ